ncbi:DUF423 domain-containing protein [Sphingobacteriaceae bacterium AH-315-L07]|nr:DUF423 domain-containing protein [Bacteroidia bacterium]MBN4052390.1 DUF423 domain-containing protein [Sphingobacteriaceae bacterium AH-315-L07]
MHKLLLIIGSSYGLLSVLLGAFGAHALKAKLTLEQLNAFETGVKYQFYHALVLLFVGMYLQKYSNQLIGYAGYLFITGVVLFSGSLYLIATKNLLGIESWKWLGPITPIGGTLLIIGWVLLLIAFIKN